MLADNTEQQIFKYLANYQLAVCRECQYTVQLDQIKGHLQKQYKKLLKRAQAISNTVCQQLSLLQYSSKLEILSNSINLIPQLLVYNNSLLCYFKLARCQYIMQSRELLRRHQHKVYVQLASKKRRRPSLTQAKVLQAQLEDSYKRIYC